VALLGAHGAGKSTTLKAISGLLKTEDGEVTRGEILFNGERINEDWWRDVTSGAYKAWIDTNYGYRVAG
jgi:ABC-type multidrug transport system ATPase subunit